MEDREETNIPSSLNFNPQVARSICYDRLTRERNILMSKLNLTTHLRPSLPEDQAGVIHAISPFWMKLCQIEGTTQQL